MKSKIISTILLAALIINFCCACAAITIPDNSETPNPGNLIWSDIKYTDLNRGISSFVNNFIYAKNSMMTKFLSISIDNMSVSESKIDNYRKLVSIAASVDAFLQFMLEFETLPADELYPDNAYGTLASISCNAYRIEKYSQLEFGYAGTLNSVPVKYTGVIKLPANRLSVIQTDNAYTHYADIVLTDAHTLIIRYITRATSSTEAFFAVLTDDDCCLGYYSGNKDLSRIPDFSELIEYDFASISFGLGTSIKIVHRDGQFTIS